MPWTYGVVPVAMEGIVLDVDAGHFGIAYLEAFWVAVLVDFAGDDEAGVGRGGADQLDDDLMADERFATPVLRDVGEQTVLDAVPFTGARRQMGDCHGEAGLIGEALQFALPEPDASAVAAATVRGDGEASSLGIARFAEPLPPAPDALDGERGGIGIDPDVDPALVGGNVVDALGGHLAQGLDLEVMDAHRLGIAPAA